MHTTQSQHIGYLLTHFQQSSDPKIVKQSQAVMLYLKSWCVRDIAKACLQEERTIYRWVKAYETSWYRLHLSWVLSESECIQVI